MSGLILGFTFLTLLKHSYYTELHVETIQFGAQYFIHKITLSHVNTFQTCDKIHIIDTYYDKQLINSVCIRPTRHAKPNYIIMYLGYHGLV